MTTIEESFPEYADVLGRKKVEVCRTEARTEIQIAPGWVMKASKRNEPDDISIADVHYVNDFYASGNAIGW